MKYKVGDKVRVRSDLVVGRLYGVWPFTRTMSEIAGKVVEIKRVSDLRGAYMLKDIVGEYWYTDEMLEPVHDVVFIPKPTWRIIIQGDENTSQARYIVGGRVVKEASAKRYHKDKHDPAMAARALIGKMFPEEKKPEKPKYFTGRVVCVERPEGVWLTVGKIYEVNDGVMGCDEKYVEIDKITSVENLNSRVKKGVKFIEIKE